MIFKKNLGVLVYISFYIGTLTQDKKSHIKGNTKIFKIYVNH